MEVTIILIPAKLVHVSACVNIDQCVFFQGKMQLYISWILLVSSASLSSAELPSINDDEGNKQKWHLLTFFYFLEMFLCNTE